LLAKPGAKHLKPKESLHGTAGDVLSVYQGMLNHLEDEKCRYQEKKGRSNSAFVSGLQAAIDKLRHYYAKAAETPEYIVAVYCDPRCKLAWFEWAWKDEFPEWYARVERVVREYYNRGGFCNGTGKLLEERDRSYKGDFASWSSSRWDPLAPHRKQIRELDELDIWEQTPMSDTNAHVLEYWLKHEFEFPSMFRMSLSVFSIPATSAEIERVFSR
jgi:hAT family C-terminal dimerisation region